VAENGLKMTKKILSPGIYRALQRASANDGLFHIVAIDHQDALRRVINPDAPAGVSAETMTRLKMEVVATLLDDASAVLLDPLFGAFQSIASDNLGNKGLLVELEKADYQMEPMPLVVEIDPNWSVARIKQLNADGVKLFFYYNPRHKQHAAKQEALIRRVASDCARLEIPFYAEPIVYRTEDDPPESDRGLVAESARRIAQLGAVVLKLEFPVDVQKETDQNVWLEACQAITQSIDIPWALLSAGVSFDQFARQLEIACQAGASGFIVGRALWGEAAQIPDADRRLAWLRDNGRKRLKLLNAITTAYGTPWRQRYDYPLSQITADTFRQYSNPKAIADD
jgi:tagatose 1,6-diphosphate aldolase